MSCDYAQYHTTHKAGRKGGQQSSQTAQAPNHLGS